jgi:hypothetical protein
MGADLTINAGITVSIGVTFGIKGHLLAKATLVALDPGWLDFEFQFPPVDYTENLSTEFGEASSLNVDQPIQQWLKGSLDTITFDAMFFAQHAAHELKDYVDYFKRLVKRDPALGRPPIWNFIYGQVADEVVLVESIGGVKYGQLRTNANVGTIRDVHFTISLRKYRAYDLVLTDPNALPSDTFYVRAKEGDTWEHIAEKEYGKPNYGIILRQRHPESAQLEAGDLATLPDFENIRDQRILPNSIPLERTDERNAVVHELFEDRNISKYSRIVR